MTALVTSALDPESARLADTMVRWMETGIRPVDMFADEVFVDFSLPHWRLQTIGADEAFKIREDGHPDVSSTRVEALDATARGFLIQFEERWSSGGQQWYCRELIHAIVTDRRLSELSVYCTGDWDEAVQEAHARQVHLVRP